MPDQEPTAQTLKDTLTDCDREPIHVPGLVQSFGCLVAISGGWEITYASANCAEIIGYPAEQLLGTDLERVLPEDTLHFFRTRLQILSLHDSAVRVVSYPLFGDDRNFDVSISQSGDNLIFEFEPRSRAARFEDNEATVQALIKRIRRHQEVDAMAAEGVRALKALCGFDRVMAYRFNEDDTGSVIAEELETGMEPFLGLRYPASDIPKQARQLYVSNPFRIISDVSAPTRAILTAKANEGIPLDLSFAVTRAVSPVHLEYLRNMGVGASMSFSILRGGKLWGLFACHHRTARHLKQETRAAAELFVQLFNYELALVELNAEQADMDRGRALHDQIMSQLTAGQTIFAVFGAFSNSINAVIPFDGAAVYSDGKYLGVGLAPKEDEFLQLLHYLNAQPAGQVFHTNSLWKSHPEAETYQGNVAGLLALPLSRIPGDYLVLFRHEITQTVNWAGNPEKPISKGSQTQRLSPRKSFEAWKETVRGQCEPWRTGELRVADALRVALFEVALQMAEPQDEIQEQTRDQQELLIAELNHRVRNILNLIRGLVSQSAGGTDAVDTYRSVLDSRISALARAHDLISIKERSWVSFRHLIETETAAFTTENACRVQISGDEIDLSPTSFTTLALVFHELVTNSAKYGGLTSPSGSILIDVEMRSDGEAHLKWRENGGPPVKEPERKGFGTTIIEHSVPYELQGQAEMRFAASGVEADFVLPAKFVRPSQEGSDSATGHTSLVSGEVTLNGHCLVLEDNMVIALDASEMLKALGANSVSTASTVSQALDALSGQTIQFALLDADLGEETSLAVVQKCAELGIKAILATGYGSDASLIAQFPAMALVNKPYTLESLRMALSEATNPSQSI